MRYLTWKLELVVSYYSWYGIATDRSIDETDKYFPVLVRYEGTDGLIHTSLLDMLDINADSDVQTMLSSKW